MLNLVAGHTGMSPPLSRLWPGDPAPCVRQRGCLQRPRNNLRHGREDCPHLASEKRYAGVGGCGMVAHTAQYERCTDAGASWKDLAGNPARPGASQVLHQWDGKVSGLPVRKDRPGREVGRMGGGHYGPDRRPPPDDVCLFGNLNKGQIGRDPALPSNRLGLALISRGEIWRRGCPP